jgi:hypothetical protein
MKLEDEKKAAEEAELEREIARSEGRGKKAAHVKDEAAIKIEVCCVLVNNEVSIAGGWHSGPMSATR